MAGSDLLLVGRVVRTHGIRGHVIVHPETDFAEDRFKAGESLLFGPEDRVEPREIRDVRFHQGRPILELAGIETMNDAEALAGTEVWVRAAGLAPLPDRTFYRHDLVGCDVSLVSGVSVGRVTRVEGTIERSLLVVAGRGGEVMIPMVDGICVQVDVPARRIVINPPDGLLTVNQGKGYQDEPDV